MGRMYLVAKRKQKKWEKEADGDPFDSVWDMAGPLRYSLDNKQIY